MHPFFCGFFYYRKLYNSGNFSTIWQNETHFYTILTTNMYDKRQTKVPYGLVWYTIYIDNIQKAVVICLIIPTKFPFDAISSITRYPDVWRTLSTLDPASQGNVTSGLILIFKMYDLVILFIIYTPIKVKHHPIFLSIYFFTSILLKQWNRYHHFSYTS